MGWWYTDNGDDIIGDGPADTITDALIAISSHCRDNDREMVTLQELLNAVAKAIAHESETFLSDADHGAIRVTATFDGRSPCVSVDTAVDSDVLHELLHRFSEVAAEYLDTELERKPRLNELLAVFNFVLRADPAAYLSDGAGIQLESITGEWIKGETIDPGALLSEFKSACRAVARSTAAEQRQRLRRRIELGVGLDDIEAALRADDWEIRASAMLAVARDNLAEVGKTIRGLRFPATRSEGLDRNERSILAGLQAAVLEHLRGLPIRQTSGPLDGTPTRTREQKWAHLRACVAGESVTVRDQVFLLVKALTQPIAADAPPAELPAQIIAEGAGFRLRQSGLALRWVSPAEHWLGSDEADLPSPNPVHTFRPTPGYFIAESLVSVAVASWCDGGAELGLFDTRSLEGREPYLCAAEAAVTLCDRLAQIEGVRIRLPTADEWEAGVRGTDGRRHPWGNGFEGDPALLTSARGLRQTFGCGPQWAQVETPPGFVLCGDDRKLRCAARTPVPDEQQPCAVRPVVSPDFSP